MRIEIIIDDEAIVKKDCGCKAKKVIDLIDNLNEEEFEKIKTHMIKKEESRAYLLETKEAYVEIIADLLGLRADATVERITPAVMKKVDEFIIKIHTCVSKFKKLAQLYLELKELLNDLKKLQNTKNLAAAYLLDLALGKIKEIIYEEDLEKVVQLACFYTIKRNYAQEIQYLFFMGTKISNDENN